MIKQGTKTQYQKKTDSSFEGVATCSFLKGDLRGWLLPAASWFNEQRRRQPITAQVPRVVVSGGLMLFQRQKQRGDVGEGQRGRWGRPPVGIPVRVCERRGRR